MGPDTWKDWPRGGGLVREIRTLGERACNWLFQELYLLMEDVVSRPFEELLNVSDIGREPGGSELGENDDKVSRAILYLFRTFRRRRRSA